MGDVEQFLASGGKITQLPETDTKPFLGNIQQELIRVLQLGDKTFAELAYLGSRQTILSACSRIRQLGCPVIVFKNTISLDNPKLQEEKTKALQTYNHNFTEQKIINSVGKYFLNGKYLLAVNNFYWTGYECDLFCITNDLKPIEFEIKVSRKDFLLDGKKDKWKKSLATWKHYYLMPKAIFTDDMVEMLPHPNSGILTIVEDGSIVKIYQEKPAKANRAIKAIEPQILMNVARLVSMRLWHQKLQESV